MLNAERAGMVLVDRAVVENLVAGWDEGLWGPETQDAGIPDLITGLISSLRAALATPAPADASGGADVRIIWAGEFTQFSDWVNHATKRLGGRPGAICVDAQGRRCLIGHDFMRARDEDAFPVRYGWETVAALSAQPQPKADPSPES